MNATPRLPAAAAAACLIAQAASAEELLPVRPGYAVVTRSPTSQPEVVLLLDLRDPECDPAAVLEDAWPCERDDNALPNPTGNAAHAWTYANLGPVFGVTLDDAAPPNVYVTSTSAFRGLSGASGRVTRLDGTTGEPATFATLPNTGVGLGNICFDRVHDQFFVTNMEDGVVYRLDRTGAVLSTFDPWAPDDGSPGFPPLGDRTWGVQVFEPENRLYFGTWTEDQARRIFRRNQVWSVGLDDCGDFLADARLEITLPPVPARDFSEPVADIAFSQDGRMLVAERTMAGDLIQDAHNAVVLEYVQSGGAWTGSGRSYSIGGGTDATGGVDWAECLPQAACPAAQPHALATGDRLVGNGAGAVHGLQILPLDGGSPATSYLVQYAMDKRAAGDVAFVKYDDCPPVPRCDATASLVISAPCEAQPVTLDASGGAAVRCCGGLEHRFLDPLGAVARDWSPDPRFLPTMTGEWTVESRCAGETGCAADARAEVTQLISDPWTALEVVPAATCDRPTWTVRVVPGSFGACSAPSYRWFHDGVEIAGATGEAYVLPSDLPAGPHAYHVVVACPEPLPCGDTSAPRTVVVRDPPGPPRLAASETPPTGCSRAEVRIGLAPGTEPDCPGLEYAWLQDGSPLAGETGPELVVPASAPAGPHEYQLLLSCPSGLPCGDASDTIAVLVVDPPPGPQVRLDETPAGSCDRRRQELSVEPGSFGDCSAPSYQWYEDDGAIAGATGPSHVVPSTTRAGDHDYFVVVSCPEPLPCGDTSPELRVLVEDPPVGPRTTLDVVPATTCERDLVTLSVVPDSWGACSAPTFQWYEDGDALAGETGTSLVVPARTRPGRHSYWYVVTCPEPLPCGDTAPPTDVWIRNPPSGPRLRHEHDPGDACTQETHRLSVVDDSFGDCSEPEFRWQQDGADVPGAVGDSFIVPDDTPPGAHRYRAVISCPEPLLCGSETPWIDLVIAGPPASRVAGTRIEGLLFVHKSPAVSATSVELSWTDSGPATAHHVYEGTIGTWYDHAGGACALPRTGSPSHVAAMPAGARYFLVGPADCLGEGLLGSDSLGTDHPVPGIGSPCGPAP